MRWLPSWKLFAGVAVFVTMSLVVGLLIGYAATSVPEIQKAALAETSTVVYADGKSVITKFVYQQQNRIIIDDPARIPDFLKYAVISAEDRTFFTNKGISPLGILRAAWNNLRGGSLQGGSTITQQYVKNTRITNERSFSRKFKEFFIAIKIANSTDKQTLLAEYLNTIYFGRGAYGVEAAAKAYFNKDAFVDANHPANLLTVPQAAYLAGVIDGPSLYDVDANASAVVRKNAEAKAKARFDYVLDGMVKLKVISQEERNKYTTLPTLVPKQRTSTGTAVDDQSIYLASMVSNELGTLPGGWNQDKIDSGGYQIYTTFDKTLVDKAAASVEKTLGPRTLKNGKPNWPEGTQVGMATVDPSTGAVKAIYGGDGKRFQNSATQDRAPGGSTFKLFSLVAALEGSSNDHSGQNGLALGSLIDSSSPYTYVSKGITGPRKVYNLPGESAGLVDLKYAFKHSINTVFARLNEIVGPAHTKDVAERAGIPKAVDGIAGDLMGSEPSNTLGNAPVSAKDMATAYGTIANLGVYNKAYVIDKIVKIGTGQVVYQHSDNTATGERRFAEDVCKDAIDALREPVSGGGTAAVVDNTVDFQAAGKTGTVGVSGKKDTKSAWFVGFTPTAAEGQKTDGGWHQLVTAVGMYRDREDNGTHLQENVVGWGKYSGPMLGGQYPAQLWASYMKNVVGKTKLDDFPAPAGVGELNEAAQQAAQQAQQQQQGQQTPGLVLPDGTTVFPTDPNTTITGIPGLTTTPGTFGGNGTTISPNGQGNGNTQGNQGPSQTATQG